MSITAENTFTQVFQDLHVERRMLWKKSRFDPLSDARVIVSRIFTPKISSFFRPEFKNENKNWLLMSLGSHMTTRSRFRLKERKLSSDCWFNLKNKKKWQLITKIPITCKWKLNTWDDLKCALNLGISEDDFFVEYELAWLVVFLFVKFPEFLSHT